TSRPSKSDNSWALAGSLGKRLLNAVFDERQLPRKSRVNRCGAGLVGGLRNFAEFRLDVASNLFERSSRKENPANPAFVHDLCIFGCARPAASPKNADAGLQPRSFQTIDNLTKKFLMPAVVTGDPHRNHIFLDRRTHNVLRRTVISKINDFNAEADKFDIDRVDRTIVPVTNGDGRQNSDRRHNP